MPRTVTRSVRLPASVTPMEVERALTALPAHPLGINGRVVRARTDSGAAGWGDLITVTLPGPRAGADVDLDNGVARAQIVVEPVRYLSVVSEFSARRVAARVARVIENL